MNILGTVSRIGQYFFSVVCHLIPCSLFLSFFVTYSRPSSQSSLTYIYSTDLLSVPPFFFRKKIAFTAGGPGSLQVFSDFEHVLTHTKVNGGTYSTLSHSCLYVF